MKYVGGIEVLSSNFRRCLGKFVIGYQINNRSTYQQSWAVGQAPEASADAWRFVEPARKSFGSRSRSRRSTFAMASPDKMKLSQIVYNFCLSWKSKLKLTFSFSILSVWIKILDLLHPIFTSFTKNCINSNLSLKVFLNASNRITFS